MQTIQRRLSAYRNEIKGFAILWVVLFHAQLGWSGLLYDVQKIGYGGVDIFLFLSGFGLYHSLSVNREPASYFKRRAMRLLPAYVPFCLVWLAVMLPLYGGGLATSLRILAGNLTMLGYLADVPLVINWYMSLLLLTLLLAPVLYLCLKPGKHYWLRVCAVMAALFLAGFAYIGNDRYMVMARLPIFALGMVFARPYDEEKQTKALPVGLAAAFAVGMALLYLCHARYPQLLNDYAMYWHPFVLITPALCVGLGWISGHLPAVLRRLLGSLGRASFEIFLFNAWLEVLGKKYGLCKTPEQWALWSMAAIVVGLMYHGMMQKIIQKTVDNRR